MAFVLKDRVFETSTTTGTGTYTLAGAKDGYQAFSAIGDGNTTYYVATDGTNWETGQGVYTASGTTLTRASILSSSNSNSAVSWGAGEKDIFCAVSEAKTVFEDDSNNITVGSNITVGGTVDGRDLATDGAKLDGIEASATADQTAAEIRTLVESATDSNVFTDADHTKLNGIETSATADQSDSEIKTAYENNSDTNAFTDALQTKLNGVAASANNYVHPNHSGEVTSTADGATVIADNVVDEANLKVSNTPTNGYFLSAQSGNTGGLTWAAVSGGYSDSDVNTHLNQSSASSNQYLKWNGSDYAWGYVYGYYGSPTFYNLTIQGYSTFNNSVTFNSQVTVWGSFNNYSDDRLKVKSNNIPEALSKINKLNGFYYTDSDTVTDIKKGEDKEGNQLYQEKETTQKLGVSAQELEAVLPEVISKLDSSLSATNTEYLAVDYTKIVPLLIEGIKELKTKVETLETENVSIKARLDALEA
jgi:hypothetical protein